MRKRRLVILIEGDDDKIFFERLIKAKFERRYYPVVLWKYQEKTPEVVDLYLRTEEKKGAEYIFVADNDKVQCVSKRKAELQDKYDSIDDKNKILVVVKKIEGWYFAGLNEDACEELGLPPLESTDKIGKGILKKMKGARFRSDIALMQEALRHFDIETAKRKNNSLKYFVDKYGL